MTVFLTHTLSISSKHYHFNKDETGVNGQCFTMLITAFTDLLGDSLVACNYHGALLACSPCWRLSCSLQLNDKTGLKLNPLSDLPCCFCFLGSRSPNISREYEWSPNISREYEWIVVTSTVAVS